MSLNCAELGLYNSLVNTLLPMRRDPPYVTGERKIKQSLVTKLVSMKHESAEMRYIFASYLVCVSKLVCNFYVKI